MNNDILKQDAHTREQSNETSYAITHIRPDGTRMIITSVDATSMAKAKRQFKRQYPKQAKHYRPFTIKLI